MQDIDIDVILERIERLNKTIVDIYYNQMKQRLDNIQDRIRRLESFALDNSLMTKDIGLIVSQTKDQVDYISEAARH